MSGETASLSDRIKSWSLFVLPHQLLSRGVRALTRWRLRVFKNTLISVFARHFRVDMREAEVPELTAYEHFNAFFTRALAPGARPLPDDPLTLACPVDGTVSEAGAIHGQRLLQVKGCEYTLEALLGGDRLLAGQFRDGSFATLYLSPRDYHRIHMPCEGQLQKTLYVPGRLYSVAPHTVRAIPGLFTRNERLVCLFDTAVGPMAMILVGAIFVSCMETVWSGVVNPRLGQSLLSTDYGGPGKEAITLARGAEMGRFNMGSTVILLFGKEAVRGLESLASGQPVRLGEAIADPASS